MPKPLACGDRRFDSVRVYKAVGFVPLPQRWVVERTFGWFNWSRHLSKDYEILTDTFEAFLYIAMIRLSLGRLA